MTKTYFSFKKPEKYGIFVVAGNKLVAT